jgi:5-methylcytosine-specific restriction endonuclease McrA
MTCNCVKRRRVRLDNSQYARLSKAVLARDGWRCQACGKAGNLQVHHMQSRAQGGDDAEANLMTLCCSCHAQIHGRKTRDKGNSDVLT